MFKRYGKKLLSSDWHLLHHNIPVFEFEKRKRFLKGIPIAEYAKDSDWLRNHLTTLDPDGKLAFATKMTENMLLDAIDWLETNDLSGVEEYLNLGDYLFNPNKKRVNALERGFLNELNTELKSKFAKAGIKTTIIRGNHDFSNEKLGKYASVEEFLLNHFDTVSDFRLEGTDIYTHMPLGSSKCEFRPAANHCSLDKELLEIAERHGNYVRNFHGHLHSNDFEGKISIVEYVNCSLEMLE